VQTMVSATKKANRIPEISDERLTELYKRIKPVVTFRRKVKRLRQHQVGELYFIKDVNPRNVAFTWDPKPLQRVDNQLVLIGAIPTYHTWGYYGFFKPSIAEVIAQIPDVFLDEVVAFETLTDITLQNIIGDYHVTITKLYGANSDGVREMVPRIPRLSETKLQERYERIKPIMRFVRRDDRFGDYPEDARKSDIVLVPYEGGIKYWLDGMPLNGVLTKSPRPGRQVQRDEVSSEPLAGVLTWHPYEYSLIPEPTVAEALVQIPKEYLDKTVAFETLTQNFTVKQVVGNYHATITLLYPKRGKDEF